MRAALYIDGDSIEARYIASVCGEIRHTDDIIMKKLFRNNGERDAWCDAAHRFHLNEYVSMGKSGENGNVLHMAVEVMADTAENKLERVYIDLVVLRKIYIKNSQFLLNVMLHIH